MRNFGSLIEREDQLPASILYHIEELLKFRFNQHLLRKLLNLSCKCDIIPVYSALLSLNKITIKTLIQHSVVSIGVQCNLKMEQERVEHQLTRCQANY